MSIMLLSLERQKGLQQAYVLEGNVNKNDFLLIAQK